MAASPAEGFGTKIMNPSGSDASGSDPNGSGMEAAGQGRLGQPDTSTENTVVLRIEYITDAASKAGVAAFRVIIVAALALLIWEGVWKYSSTANVMQTNKLIHVNIALASVCLAGVLGVGSMFAYRVMQTIRGRKHWNTRRRFFATLVGLELLLQVATSSLYLAPNVFSLVVPCGWFLAPTNWMGLGRFAGWNSILVVQVLYAFNLLPAETIITALRALRLPVPQAGSDGGKLELGLDFPRWIHASLYILLWVPCNLILLFMVLYMNGFVGSYYITGCNSLDDERCFPPDIFPPDVDCRQWPWGCIDPKSSAYGAPDNTFAALTILLTCWTALNVLIYVALLLTARHELQRRPYGQFRVAHVELGLQMRTRCVLAGFFFICLIVLWFPHLRTCNSLMLTWLGLGPFDIALATLISENAVVHMPIAPAAHEVKLHAWLQDHAWTEADVPHKLAQRPFTGEPCFCFETAWKMMMFSSVAYEDVEASEVPTGSLQTALELYDLQHHELLWHRKTDAKCLIAWSADTVVLAFRGTASLTNALSDIQVWRAAHPPKRGNYWLRTQPMVHSGFLQLFQESGLQGQVLEKLSSIMDSGGKDESRKRWRVLVTGHSLGGALALLAAYDIAAAADAGKLPVSKADIALTTVTYGCPRPGNHAFARDYKRRVPDSWDVFHPDDAVARAGKFWVLYKRASHAVMVSRSGDLVVRPSNAEAGMLRSFGARIADHMLTRYAKTFATIVRAQFTRKALAGARPAVARLLEGNHMRMVLRSVAGLQHDLLGRSGSGSIDEEAAAEEPAAASAEDRHVATGKPLQRRFWPCMGGETAV